MSTKKKNKKTKIKELKNKSDRVMEIVKNKTKLRDLGLSEEHNGIEEFYNHCKIYVNDGISWSGKIKLHGLKRVLEASLPIRKNTSCSMVLKYDSNV